MKQIQDQRCLRKKALWFFSLLFFLVIGPMIWFTGRPLLTVKENISPHRQLASGQVPLQESWCKQWGQPKKIGELEIGTTLNEASGIAPSFLDPTSLYHITDTNEGGGFLYITDHRGPLKHKVKIIGHEAIDYEDLTSGPCYNGKSCVFIGDLGDNHLERDHIKILVFEENLLYQTKATPTQVLHLRYPEGESMNAEALAIHPISGDLFIVTKESSNKDRDIKKRDVPAAKIFKLPRNLWSKNIHERKFLTLEKVEKIKMSQITMGTESRKQLITGFDIAPDGKSFVLLTYHDAYEFLYDLSNPSLSIPSKKMEENVDFLHLKLFQLPQQEAITYFRGNHDLRPGLIYHTELRSRDIGMPLMHIPCLDEF